MYCIKDKRSLVPVCFSDCRISSELIDFPIRQTYINCGEITFSSIKSCLSDKHKVSLSPQDGHTSFQVFENGQELSTGLNVIVGERSSGKTFTLNKINRSFEDIKYIEQFSLMVKDEELDKANFDKMLSQSHSLFTQEYLKEFQKVVNDVTPTDIEENEKSVSNYINSLIKHAKEF